MAVSGEIIRAVVTHTIAGAGESLLIFTWEVQSDISDDDARDDLNAWIELNWYTQWEPVASNAAEISGTKVLILNNDGTTNRVIGTRTLALSGGVADQTQAGGVAAGLFAGTDAPKTRGRKFIPGISEAGVLNGILTAAVQTALSQLLIQYLATFTGVVGGTYVPGVLSTTLLRFVPFNLTGGFDDIPDYQRRRKPGVGS